MKLFFHKHPLICFVFAACLFTAVKAGFTMAFHTSEQDVARAEISQAIGAIASRQVELQERDVLAAIQLFRNTSKRQANSAGAPQQRLGTLGLITQAQATQTAAQRDPDLFKRAGFTSYEQVPGVLASVSLGAFVLALEDSQISLRKAIREGAEMAADPDTGKTVRAQLARQMNGLSNQLQVLELMAKSAKILPGNLKLIKLHRRAIVQAMSAARA
ncbi:MAG: hypothetical protein AAGI06_16770 [Pseudomonadota bacterium]